MTQETSANQPAGNAPSNGASPNAAEAKPALSSLLQQFESSAATPAKSVADFVQAVTPALTWVDQQRVAQETAALKADISNSVKAITAELKLGDEYADITEGYLYKYSNDHPEFANAWDNRQSNADTWKTQLDKARAAFGERVSKIPGNTVRNELDAAFAASRNVSTAPQSPEQHDAVALTQMSDRDYANYKAKLRAQPGYKP
jgi:hypothetical protein